MKYAKRMLALMLTMLPVLAVAQLQDTNEIVAQVPFKFMVGGKMLPAGECVIDRASPDGKTIAIRNWSASANLFSSVSPVESKNVNQRYALVFHQYGDRYFLTGLELRGSRTIYRLPETRAEAEMRAQNVPESEQTLTASLK
jgi:hypothetical protein